MKDGDIFNWTFKSDDIQHGPLGSYHCYSQIAVFDEGVLRDTYWDASGSCKKIDPDKVNLVYRGNIKEMETINQYQVPFYRLEDVVDTRHANNSRSAIYIKPGARRDAERMREHIQYKIECSKREIKSAKRHIEWLRADLQRIDAGKLDEVMA